MSLSFTSTKTPQGDFAFVVDGGRDGRAAAVVANPAIVAELNRIGSRIGVLRERYTDAALPAEIRAECRALIGLIGTAVQDGRGRKRQYLAAMADHATIPNTVVRTWFPQIVERFIALGLSDKIRFARDCDITSLAALVDAGPDLCGLPGEEWATVTDRALALFYAERAGIAARYPAQPSLDGSLFAIGPDNAAVEAAAKLALDGARATGDALDAEEESLKRVILVVAVMTGMKPEEVLAQALGAA